MVSFCTVIFIVLTLVCLFLMLQVIDDNDNESSDEEIVDMMVDEPKPNKMAVDEPKPKQMTDEEGWSVVVPRRNRGKRSG